MESLEILGSKSCFREKSSIFQKVKISLRKYYFEKVFKLPNAPSKSKISIIILNLVP